MSDLELREEELSQAAYLLTEASLASRNPRPLPLLQADTYTGVGEVLAGFMRSVDLAAEVISECAAQSAAAVAQLMQHSTETEAELTRLLGATSTK